MIEQPKLIDGGLSVDGRGQLSFLNDLEGFQIKRLYLVQNHQMGLIRGWHGHHLETKLAFVIQGSVLLQTLPMEKGQDPRSNYRETASHIQRFILSDRKPQGLLIPPGHYNGFKTLTPEAKIMFFSNKTLEESKNDDIRIGCSYPIPEIWDVLQQ